MKTLLCFFIGLSLIASSSQWGAAASLVPAPPSSIFTPTPQDKACMQAASSCGRCVDQGPHCGWCNETQSCLSGYASFGPTMCKLWVAYQETCDQPNPCGASTAASSCDTCVDTTWDCGFCQTSQTCMQGNVTGPKNQQCSGGWSFGHSARSCSHCQTMYRDCDTCQADPGCGWCPGAGPSNTGRCFAGDASGAYYANGNSCSGWSHRNVSACPARTPAPTTSQCQMHTDCTSCLAAQLDSQCGWCASKGKCFQGNSIYPFGSNTCEYRWHWDQCVVNCSVYTNCLDCSSGGAGECGWCMMTQTCQRGTSSGPFEGSCFGSYWQFGSYTCPGCSNQGTQGGCQRCFNNAEGSGGCGYCSTTESCVEGSPDRPFSGTCPIGNWTYDVTLCPGYLTEGDDAQYTLNRFGQKTRV